MKRIVWLICLVLPSAFSWSQTGFNARSMGMAGAYQGMARGAEVSSWNPANLALPGGPGMSLDFLDIGFNLGNNSFNINLYNDYFGQDYFDANEKWDDTAKNDIVDNIPSSGFRLYNRTQVTPLAFSYQQYALAMNTFVYADFRLPQKLIEVPLKGLGTDPVDLNDIDGEAIWGSEIVLSGGRMFQPDWDWVEFVTVGASFKYLIGSAYAVVSNAAGTLLSNADSIAINGSYKANVVVPFDDKGQTGHGVGLDLGATAKINEKLTLGFSLHNIFGSIRFGSSEEYQGSFAFNQPGLNIDEFDHFGDYLDSVSVETDTSYHSDENIKYVLPKSFVLSGTYKLSPKVVVEADYHQGLSNSAGGTTTPRLAVGTEIRYLKILPLRFGLGLGGIQRVTLAWGFGLDFGAYQLDFAMAGQQGLFNGSRGINFALSQRLIF